MGNPLLLKQSSDDAALRNADKWQQWKDDAEARGAPVDDPPPLVDLTKPQPADTGKD